ncbi:MAG: UDP-N-acetylmuramoyl-L-alanyl-D-glutamate--2,6-diaminopimelate ligase [Bacteroidota bacterium]
MKLAQLLVGVAVSKMFQTMYGRMVVTHDTEIHGIQYDSRKVAKGDCFVAIRGSGVDGHNFIQSAVSNGASAVVMENDGAIPDPYFMHSGVIKIVVPDSRKALAQISANYYGHPANRLTMVGVTGTNGKTTTTHVVKSLLEAAGKTTGLIGTIEYMFGKTVLPASHTTPESLELNELLDAMLRAGCVSVSMEVSSHALHQSRVDGISFDVAVFTNLTQDHLDYHGTMEEYFSAKQILFRQLKPGGVAVVNAEDDWGKKIVTLPGSRTVTYGLQQGSDFSSTEINFSIQGTTFNVRHQGKDATVHSPLVGRFNVYNVLAAYAAGTALGVSESDILRGISGLKPVRGRFERIASPKGWTAIVDYAHTPDALEKCLKAIGEVLPQERRGKIITVFGAGGDRDKTKRPLMGKIAAQLSDAIIVTSDNPRTENPEAIIDDILAGVPRGAAVKRESDRRKAIEQAARMAKAGDVILVAGKGHEDYQVIGKEKIHLSDREIVESLVG